MELFQVYNNMIWRDIQLLNNLIIVTHIETFYIRSCDHSTSRSSLILSIKILTSPHSLHLILSSFYLHVYYLCVRICISVCMCRCMSLVQLDLSFL
uniref:Uncharacterized protein n=1 Tax=Octopus bimaculoides TaxID=37653 RepID=A0A0L8FT29_OCTBM